MKKYPLTALVTATALLITACGGQTATDSGSSDETPATDELTAIEVGVIPIVDVAPIYLGVEEGIFESHGLDVTLTQAQGGAAIVPAVQSGDMEFGFSNNASLIIARDTGLPLRAVAAGPQSTGDAETDFAAVLAMGDSGIGSVADLEGKRVAVNTLNNILDATVSEGVRQAGGDPQKVEYVEIAPPEMLAQLEAGNVDAINTSEPFIYFSEEAGAERVYGMFAEPIEDLSVSSYFTTDDLIEQDPDLVDQFTAAVQESQEYATDNPDKVRNILSSYMTLEADVADNIALPLFPQGFNIDSIEELARLLEESGSIDEASVVDELILSPESE